MATIKAEIVRNYKDMSTGLMNRKHLPKNAGMLFDFGNDQPLSFWMKNTYLPLQIAFIDTKGVVKHIASMAPLSTSSVRSNSNCRYALEVNEGWFDENNIRIGATVAVPNGVEEPQIKEPVQSTEPTEKSEQKKSPELVIEQSFKDILNAANDYTEPVVIEYVTKSGKALPPKKISPPYIFGDTSDGDINGLVTVWDEQDADYKSFIVNNIISIKDSLGNPILNSEMVANLSKSTPNKVVDDMSAKGKLA